MKDNDLGEGFEDVYDKRINGLTLEVDNFHGLYRFTECKENATPFNTEVEMPIDLEVDFDSAEKGYTNRVTVKQNTQRHLQMMQQAQQYLLQQQKNSEQSLQIQFLP